MREVLIFKLPFYQKGELGKANSLFDNKAEIPDPTFISFK